MPSIFQIQGVYRGQWDSEYVDPEPFATDFSTLAEAEAELENLVAIQGRIRSELRIREVSKWQNGTSATTSSR